MVLMRPEAGGPERSAVAGTLSLRPNFITLCASDEKLTECAACEPAVLGANNFYLLL